MTLLSDLSPEARRAAAVISHAVAVARRRNEKLRIVRHIFVRSDAARCPIGCLDWPVSGALTDCARVAGTSSDWLWAFVSGVDGIGVGRTRYPEAHSLGRAWAARIPSLNEGR